MTLLQGEYNHGHAKSARCLVSSQLTGTLGQPALCNECDIEWLTLN
jgi:hypothetical protein